MKHDYVDRFAEEWRARRPELDVATMAGILRVYRIGSLMEQELAEIAGRHGLKLGQLNVLTALRRFDPEPMPPKQMLKAALLTSGAVTPILDKLEEAGLVVRKADPNDRRGVMVALTDAGRKRVDAALAERIARNLELSHLLSRSEREALASIGRKLLLAIEGEG